MDEWVLVIDDDAAILRMASKILVSSCIRASCVRGGKEALAFLSKISKKPDLILLDIHMPVMDGFETLRELKTVPSLMGIPVVFLTADDDGETEAKALKAGAIDFITKPIVPEVLLGRVHHVIELTRLQSSLQAQVEEQTKALLEQQERITRINDQLVHTLAGAIDAKDTYTKGHSERVALYSREIARRFGCSEEEQNAIYMTALLHDIGKIGIKDTILTKPGKLTNEEYAIIKTHPEKGDAILRTISEFPELCIGARWHHERYDGNGYPDGKAGEDIPQMARIIAVADAYDAMSSLRSYRSVLSQDAIRSEIVNGRGTQFDPTYADIMLQMIDEDSNFRMRVLAETELPT